MKTDKAFSLIELTTILAIISLLAAVAIPSFFEAKTAAQISRAKDDMRIIKQGLEAYKIDHLNYPQMNDLNSCVLTTYSLVGGRNWPTLERLTTPISYLSGLSPFWDPFEATGAIWGAEPVEPTPPSSADRAEAYKQYHYVARAEREHASWGDLAVPSWYLLHSAGPDRIHHYIGTMMNHTPVDASDSMRAYWSQIIYDPTNGSVSHGNIWQVGGTPEGRGSVLAELIERENSSHIERWEKY